MASPPQKGASIYAYRISRAQQKGSDTYHRVLSSRSARDIQLIVLDVNRQLLPSGHPMISEGGNEEARILGLDWETRHLFELACHKKRQSGRSAQLFHPNSGDLLV